ncbi:hypothetical protein DFH06DRAFT_990172 [Mycena polygramma]|nr:hypothetical protein DFH06DRAFT_990172 [Mycena polygramma]
MLPSTNLTSFVPSDQELREIRAFLTESRTQLGCLDSEIKVVAARLDQLKSERHLLTEEIATHSSFTAPIRRIPQEMLQEIFLGCLPTDRNAPIDIREAPLLIGRICRNWRIVSRDMPRLWCSLHIHGLERYREILGYHPIPSPLARLVEGWFRRAGNIPLSISFTQDDDMGFVNLPALDVHSSHRIRCLEITMDTIPAGIKALLALGAEHVPLLESVVLHSAEDLGPEDLNILQNRRLRHLSISRDYSLLPHIWMQLTELCLETWPTLPYLSAKGALEALSRCKNVVRCDLYLNDHWIGDDPIVQPMRLPFLQYLSVFHYHGLTHVTPTPQFSTQSTWPEISGCMV